MSTELQKYAATNLDRVQEVKDRLQREKTERDSGTYYKPKTGRNVLRFMPPHIKMGDWPFVEVYDHFIPNPFVPKSGRSALCPRRMLKQKCLVCEHAFALLKSAQGKKAAQPYWPRKRVYANVVDTLAPDTGVQIYAFGSSVYDQLIGYLGDKEAGGDFTNPVTGFNVIIDKTGTDWNDIEYQARLAKTATPITNQKWLDELHDLTKVVEYMAEDELVSLLSGDKDAWNKGKSDYTPPATAGAAAGGERTAEDDAFDPAE